MRSLALLLVVILVSMVAAGCGSRSSDDGDSDLRCRDQRAWGSYLKEDTNATLDELMAALGTSGVALSDDQRAAFHESAKTIVKWRLIRFLLIEGENHNFGSIELKSIKNRSGKPVRVYRSGFTPRPDHPRSCFQDLLDRGGVRHVVSLYAGEMPTQDLERAEQQAAERSGATYFSARQAPPALSSWRHAIDERGDDPDVVKQAMSAVATLINEQILRPQGNQPTGNIHVHCAGGMHRTSMVVGVLDRCLNDATMDAIERDYKRHVGWQGEASPGGYEPGNLTFIRDFDCSLLAHSSKKSEMKTGS